MSTLHIKLLRELKRHAIQIVSIALVMGCGVMAIMGLRGTEVSIRAAGERYFREYRLADVFAYVQRAPQSVLARAGVVPGVLMAEARIVRDVKLDVPGLAEPATGHVVSVPDHGRPALNDLHVRRGRWLAPQSTNEALVSERFAELNDLHAGDSVAAVINGRWQSIHIVGIATSPEYVVEFAHGFWVDNRRYGVLWMNIAALESAFDMRGSFNSLAVKLAPGATERSVIRELDALLAPWGSAGAYPRRDQAAVRVLEDEFTQLRTNATVFPLFFLLVAAYLLNVVLSRLVASQREEIASLKAFGYRDTEIGAHYLGFGIAVVVIGAAIGVPAGMWMTGKFTALYATYFRFPSLAPIIDWQSAFTAIGVSGAFALFGALGGVRRVMVMTPADALRPESPKGVRRLFVEVLGFGAVLPAGARMVLRNLERRPIRTGATVIGIGLAVALLVAGQFPYDAFDRLLEIEFRVSQRYSAAATFVGERSTDAIAGIRNVDGVTSIEPFRATAVRITRGTVTRNTSLTGINPGGRLYRLTDTDGRIYVAPEAGVVLTVALARALGIAAGDTIALELLERGTHRHVVVAGLIDPMIGQGVFASLATVNSLVRDDAVSGAYIAIAPGAEARVFERMKLIPGVAAVTSRTATVRNLEQQMRDGMTFMLTIIITSAVLISLGVVYNSARIALSERGRELASLRVLGFTSNEVAGMLLGEQLAILVLALPVGVGLGALFSYALVAGFETERFHFPFVIAPESVAVAAAVTVASAALAAVVMRWRVGHLDLVRALRTRE